MSDTPQFNAALQRQCQTWVDRLGHEIQGLQAALVASADGFELASYFLQTNNASRIAAMASSMAALADAVCSEGRLQAHRSMVVQAEKGNFVVFQVSHPHQPLTLCLISDEQAVLGQILHFGRLCADELATA